MPSSGPVICGPAYPAPTTMMRDFVVVGAGQAPCTDKEFERAFVGSRPAAPYLEPASTYKFCDVSSAIICAEHLAEALVKVFRGRAHKYESPHVTVSDGKFDVSFVCAWDGALCAKIGKNMQWPELTQLMRREKTAHIVIAVYDDGIFEMQRRRGPIFESLYFLEAVLDELAVPYRRYEGEETH